MTDPLLRGRLTLRDLFAFRSGLGLEHTKLWFSPWSTSFVPLTNTRSKAEAGNLCTVLVRPSKNRTNSCQSQNRGSCVRMGKLSLPIGDKFIGDQKSSPKAWDLRIMERSLKIGS